VILFFQESGLTFHSADIAVFSPILSLSDAGKEVLYSKSVFFDSVLFVFSFGCGVINRGSCYYIASFGVFWHDFCVFKAIRVVDQVDVVDLVDRK